MRRRAFGLLGGVACLGGALAAALLWPRASASRMPGHSLAAGPAAMAEAGLSGTAIGIAPGVVVTNSHVTLGCRRHGRPVQLSGLPGPWRILVEDPDTDLALLQGPAGATPSLPVSSATRLPRGTPVLALGYPATAAGSLHSATGQVLRAVLTVHDPAAREGGSFVLRDRQGQEVAATWEDGLRYYGPQQAERLRWLLEVDALLAAGSSGGPVLDGVGNLVGVIHAGDGRRGLTAVVPLDDLRDLLRRANIMPRFGTRSLATAPDWRAIGRQAAPAIHRVTC